MGREHRVAGKAMLSGTAYLELVRAVFTAHTAGRERYAQSQLACA